MLSYRELDRDSNRLAQRLTRAGVRPEDRVGLAVPRGADALVAMVAVWKCGAAFVPLDLAAPAERRRFIVDDCAIAVVITPELLAGLDAEPAEPLDVARPPELLAYVIYTSGSTGQPKGVAIEHVTLARFAQWYASAFAMTHGDRVASVSALTFDASIADIVPALVAGAAIVFADDETRLSPERLAAWCDAERLTIALWPTAFAEGVLRLPAIPSTMRVLNTGGDVLHPIRRATLPLTLVNNYGPTECTVAATSGPVSPDAAHMPTIGRPLPGVTVHILDEQLRPVADGATGELCIGGRNVGRGYIARPGLTAERFVPDPFSSVAGARMYRTGDRGRLTASGEIEFAGRSDAQIKLRGFRIELEEIETVIGGAPGVRKAAVVVHERRGGDKQLIAHVVGDAAAIASLRTYVASRLPEYMVPSAFVAHDVLPMTSHGKYDRAALASIEPTSAAFVAPRNALEQLLARVWSQVLGVERIGAHDDFFALGGHSLKGVQIAARIHELFELDVPRRVMFEVTTVAKLAAWIAGILGEDQAIAEAELILSPEEQT